MNKKRKYKTLIPETKIGKTPDGMDIVLSGVKVPILTAEEQLMYDWDPKNPRFSKHGKPIFTSSYLVRFGEPTANGTIYTKESFNIEQMNESLREVKKLDHAKDVRAFTIDDIGLLGIYRPEEVEDKIIINLDTPSPTLPEPEDITKDIVTEAQFANFKYYDGLQYATAKGLKQATTSELVNAPGTYVVSCGYVVVPITDADFPHIERRLI